MTDHAHSAGADHHDHEHDHGGSGKYIFVFIALCVLTVISFGVANTRAIMDTPAVGWSIMMAVSCAKAMLVIAFFMHLIWEANWKYVLTIPASIMSVFLVLMLVPDIGFRTRHYSSERLLHSAPPVETAPAHGGDHHGPALPFTVEEWKHQHDHAAGDQAHAH
jgi:cytochrome c oxidase subunit IV